MSNYGGGYTPEPWTLDRLRRFCRVEGDCWLWQGALKDGGRPSTSRDAQGRSGRRLAFFLAHGREPLKGRYVFPTCGDPACLSPAHLATRTRSEQVRQSLGPRRDASFRLAVARGRRERNKLTPEQARDIFMRVWRDESPAVLALQYGVTRQMVSHIKAGRCYGLVTQGPLSVVPA